MSIIKKERGLRYTDQMIKVFPSDGRIPSPISGDNYGACEYLQLNNNYISSSSLWAPGAGESVLVKCWIDPSAEGQIYGTSAANTGLRIVKSGTTVTWYIGTTSLGTKTFEEGVHIYGFVQSDTGKSKPFYDGSMFGTATDSTSHLNYVKIGGASGGNGIRLYEALAYSYTTNSSATGRAWYHIYACVSTSSASTVGVYETRNTLTFIAPNSSGASVGPRVQYGVQLHDLKDVFGSSFHDLVAIVCEDGGIATESGWGSEGSGTSNADYPSVLTKDSQSHDMCFYMAGVPANGATHTKQGSTNYAKGELIKGRKPKWSIWNDCIKFGFYAVRNSDSSLSYYFSVFRRMNLDSSAIGQTAGSMNVVNGPVRLEDFKDYDTSKNHPPHLEVSGSDGNDLNVYVHNGFACRCVVGTLFAGLPNEDLPNSGGKNKDSDCVFFYNRGTDAKLKYRAGNLIPWNFTETQLSHQFKSYGVSAKIGFLADTSVLASAMTRESSCLCSATDATMKAKYQTTIQESEAILTGGRVDYLLDLLKDTTTAPNHHMRLYASLALVTKGTGDVGDADIVNCGSFIPQTAVEAYGHYDEKIASNSENYRLVVDSTEMIGLVNGESNAYQKFATLYRWAEGQTALNRSVVIIPFIGCYASHVTSGVQYYQPVFSAVDYVGLLELVYVENNTEHYTVCMKNSKTGQEFWNDSSISNTVKIDWWGVSDYPGGNYSKNMWRSSRWIVQGQTNIDNLATYVRVIYATHLDFGLSNNEVIPLTSTVCAHVYNKATAPYILHLRTTTYNAEHRVCLQNYGSIKIVSRDRYYTAQPGSHLKAAYICYDSDNEVVSLPDMYVKLYKNGNPYAIFYVEYDASDGRAVQFYGYSWNGTAQGSRINNLDLYVDHHTGAGDTYFWGLDNIMDQLFYGFEFIFPSGVATAGDEFTVRFDNSIN